MVFLVHLKVGYITDLYFKFEYLENALSLVERVKLANVLELSDNVSIEVTIEALTEEEFKEKIESTKGE